MLEFILKFRGNLEAAKGIPDVEEMIYLCAIACQAHVEYLSYQSRCYNTSKVIFHDNKKNSLNLPAVWRRIHCYFC